VHALELTSSADFLPVLGVIFLRHAANRFEAAIRRGLCCRGWRWTGPAGKGMVGALTVWDPCWGRSRGAYSSSSRRKACPCFWWSSSCLVPC